MSERNVPEEMNEKFAIVTGASSGIGYELAAQFAQHGYDLLIVSKGDGISQAAEDLRALGTHIESMQCDLASFEGVEQFYERIESMGRPVNVAVLNAGVGVDGKFTETSLDEEINLINLNVIGTVHLAKKITQAMVNRAQGGRLLITSSVASLAPGPYMAIYNASKAFVQSFAEALHYELKENGITVTALMPDATDTNFFERANMEDTKVGAGKKDDPKLVAERGYAALMDGKPHVFGGSLKHRIVNAVNDLIPEQTKASMYGKMAKPGSAAETTNKKKAS